MIAGDVKSRKYYVYVHKRKDNGVVFYVGKGTGLRYKAKRRSKMWKAVYTDAGGFYGELIKDNLSEVEALRLEHYYINNPEQSWELVNFKRNLELVLDIPKECLERVEYSETSPSGLIWKDSTRSKKKKGDVAGSLSPNGYWSVGIGTKLYLCHRVIWDLLKGAIPRGKVIDHIDSNRSNNLISNLQCVTQSYNCKKAKRKTSLSGSRNLTIRGNSIRLRYVQDGIRKSKTFPIIVDTDHTIAIALDFLGTIEGYRYE